MNTNNHIKIIPANLELLQQAEAGTHCRFVCGITEGWVFRKIDIKYWLVVDYFNGPGMMGFGGLSFWTSEEIINENKDVAGWNVELMVK